MEVRSEVPYQPQDAEMMNAETNIDSSAMSRRPSQRGTTVYVGNLSWKVLDRDLLDHMKKCGEVVSAKVFVDSSGRSKGCAIVEYANVADAERAMRELTDTRLFDRPIFVREDRENGAPSAMPRRPPPDRGYRNRDSEVMAGYGRDDRYNGGARYHGGNNFQPGPRFGKNGGQRMRPREEDYGRMIFVSNLPYKTTWQELKDRFRKCGNVVRADVKCYPDGKSRGVGTVLFEDPSAAENAINEMHGSMYEGRQISVRLDRF